MLEQIEAKYGLKLPRTVITIDYDENIGDLYIRFKNADHRRRTDKRWKRNNSL
ncbi:MAG: hypothetical protein M1490_04915 [Candidatus Bathyarchaeota archaeon]|nr:hypothetical protein [Candidatus Bathyarchaeota archaeon]